MKSNEWLGFLLFMGNALFRMFATLNPIGAIPTFLSITVRESLDKKLITARRSAIAAAVVLTVFTLIGDTIFNLFSISIGTFRMAGGLLLLLTAVDMVRAKPSPIRSTLEEQEESAQKDDVAIVPLGIPILAGPGSIATALILSVPMKGHASELIMFGSSKIARSICIVIVSLIACFLSWLVFRYAAKAERYLSKTMLRVLERAMGLLLTAIAMQFLIDGFRAVFYGG